MGSAAFDDTVRVGPRADPSRPEGVDHDDTVVRPGAPPVLVEPPEPPAARTAAPEPDAEPAEPPGPPRVRLADGNVVTIDVPLYIGRHPSLPRARAGLPARLVVVPSPAREVSATHVELRVVGGAVVASDMRSTNGTVVVLPGAAPRTLIRGESAVVPLGSAVDLGDGNRLEIVAPG